MNVSLTPQLEALIRRKIETGLYSSASEVIREALRLLEERDATQSAKLEALRKDVAHGVAQLDAGEGRALDVEAIKKTGRRLLAAKGRKRA
jgi:antitoxin ParD1/3/4